MARDEGPTHHGGAAPAKLRSDTTYPELAEGFVLQDCPHLDFRAESQARLVTSTSDVPVTKFKVPATPSLGSTNLLEQLRETFHSLDFWFAARGDSSGAARWR